VIESFDTSLARGQAGESLFHARFPTLVKSPVRQQDFLTASGKTVEVKSDSYDPARTPFFFLETISVVENNRVGGPFQSLGNGVDYFCYQFVRSGDIFIFRTSELCCRILELLPKYSLTRVINNGYTTFGVRIERSKFNDLLLSEEVLHV